MAWLAANRTFASYQTASVPLGRFASFLTDARQPFPFTVGTAVEAVDLNAAEHSHAREVRIAASRGRGRLTVEVVDDGIGGAAPQGGSGLRGLADRVQALGGRLVVCSPPGRGTSLRAEIPCA